MDVDLVKKKKKKLLQILRLETRHAWFTIIKQRSGTNSGIMEKWVLTGHGHLWQWKTINFPRIQKMCCYIYNQSIGGKNVQLTSNTIQKKADWIKWKENDWAARRYGTGTPGIIAEPSVDRSMKQVPDDPKNGPTLSFLHFTPTAKIKSAYSPLQTISI